MKKIITLTLIASLLIVPLILAGVTNPQPTELELERGESGRFKFQIQTIASKTDVICSYSTRGESPLMVEFDDEEVFVEANSKKYVYANVTVPQNLAEDVSFGAEKDLILEENFCVSCRNAEGVGGTAVQINTCNLPITVVVVAERTRDNMYIPPKPSPPQPLQIPTVLIISALAIAIIMTALVVHRRLKKTKKKKK